VDLAQRAACELQRVQRFLRHISHCASKLQLGVNFQPGVPNLDRWVPGRGGGLLQSLRM
jgi:hypothetical protein